MRSPYSARFNKPINPEAHAKSWHTRFMALALLLPSCGDPTPGSGEEGKSVYLPEANVALPARFGVVDAPGNPGFCGQATSEHPAVTELVLAVRAATGLSAEFSNACADCHGLDGRGAQAYPTLIPPPLDFEAVVRGGREHMPGFAPAVYSDAALASDRARLAELADRAILTLPGLRDALLPEPAPIDEEEYLAIAGSGMRAWREPGEHGSCAACHSPDGIDLARIGYTRSAILRRAIGQGRPPEDAVLIADMIEAHRRWHGIDTPCSPTLFRPLQPTGTALAEATLATDRALLDSIDAMTTLLSLPELDPVEARGLATALAELRPHGIPLGVSLSRFTSDSFHGPIELTTSEWVPEIGLEPNTKSAQADWIAASNRYLERPDPTTLWQLYEEVEQLSAARFVDGGLAERLSREKFRALVLLQHLMRTNTLELPLPDDQALAGKFPVWEAAQIARAMTRGCAETDARQPVLECWNYPPEFYVKMGTDRTRLMDDLTSFVADWFVAGWLLDPALQYTERGDARLTHLHQALLDAAGFGREQERTAELLPMHHLYFGLVRLFRATEKLDPAHKAGLDFTRPVVNGCWARASLPLGEWATGTLSALEQLGVGATRTSEHLPSEVVGQVTALATRANQLVLVLILDALDAPAPGCEAETPDPGVDLASVVQRIGSFGTPDSPAVLENERLAGEILTRL